MLKMGLLLSRLADYGLLYAWEMLKRTPASLEGDVSQTCSELNVYKTLDLKDGEPQVRLLSFAKADDFNQRLVVQLNVYSLNDAVSLKYVALSYVWGESNLTHSVECNGCQLQITRNLDLALRTSRQLGHRLLWADQICIYSHRTIIKHVRILRFAPQFFEEFNFTYLASQI